jgi:bifunctional enzyme CysN/CysC
VGEVAKLFVEAGVVVLCSFISPFKAERRMARELFAEGEFLEVFVDTDLDDCIARDPKGLYAKALKGEIANFTGVSSPYERPEAAEVVLHTAGAEPAVSARRVVDELIRRGVI